MFVRDNMSSPPITITPNEPFQDALKLMRDHHFRRLPVVDKYGKLVGIVSERDLLYASPSPATTLSVWEMNYLLSKITVEKVMTANVITTTPDTPLEHAAYILAQQKFGGLPVVDDEDHPVGIITETDIFRALVELFGGGETGLRLTLHVPGNKGVLAKLAAAIFEQNGNIISVGTFTIDDPAQKGIVLKVTGVEERHLIDVLESLGDHVIDARIDAGTE